MIQIHYPSETSETRAAIQLKKLIAKAWPEIAAHPRQTIHIVTSAQATGQARADNDIIVLFNLDEAQPFELRAPIFDERGAAHFPRSVACKSLMMTIEVKDHPESNVAFSGSSARVRYTDRWSDATEQSTQVRNGLINHMKRFDITHPPIVANVVWLRNVPDEKLPPQPHAILGRDATLHDFLTAAANTNRLIRQMANDELVVRSEMRPGAIDKALDVFARDMITLEGIPSRPLLAGAGRDGVYVPGAARKTEPEHPAVKPPRLVIEDAVDSLTEIALIHARRHVICGLSAATGAVQKVLADPGQARGAPETARTTLREATFEILTSLDKEHALPQADQMGRVKVLHRALQRVGEGLAAASDIVPAMAPALTKQASFARSAERMLEYVDIEKGRAELKDARSFRMIRDIGMPEISADAGMVVAWEGYRAMALVKSTSSKGLVELGEYKRRIESVAGMENTQRRSEETLRLLADTETELARQNLSHPLLAQFVSTARENVGFAKRWMMAAQTGERPEFFGPEPSRTAQTPSRVHETSARAGERAPVQKPAQDRARYASDRSGGVVTPDFGARFRQKPPVRSEDRSLLAARVHNPRPRNDDASL